MKKIITLLIITIVVLQAFHVYVSNTVAGDSIEVAAIRSEIKQIEEENTILKTELLSYASFYSIASRAGELGFKDDRNFITLNTPLPLAASSRTMNR